MIRAVSVLYEYPDMSGQSEQFCSIGERWVETASYLYIAGRRQGTTSQGLPWPMREVVRIRPVGERDNSGWKAAVFVEGCVFLGVSVLTC
jgi:hypothetical protein